MAATDTDQYRAYRTRHTIAVVDGRCGVDGIRVLTKRGSGVRHHPDDIARLMKDDLIARTAIPSRPASPYCESGGHPGCTCSVCFD